jgi:hypothetical protein
MHLQFLGRVSLFLFFFSLPALMQPLDPASCSTGSLNQPIPNSARDQLAESILNAAKNSSQTTQAAMFGLTKPTPGRSPGCYGFKCDLHCPLP